MCGLLSGCASDEAATEESRMDVRKQKPNTITAYVRYVQENLDHFDKFPEAQQRFREDCKRVGATDCRVHGLALLPETYIGQANFPDNKGGFFPELYTSHKAFILSSGVGVQFGEPPPQGEFEGMDIHNGDLVTVTYEDGDWIIHEREGHGGSFDAPMDQLTFFLRAAKTFEITRPASRLQCIYNHDGVVYSLTTSPGFYLMTKGPEEFLRVDTCSVDEPGSLCSDTFATAEFKDFGHSGSGFVVQGDNSFVNNLTLAELQREYNLKGIDYWDRRSEMLDQHPDRAGNELDAKVELTSSVPLEDLPVEPINGRQARAANLAPNATFSWTVRLFDAPATDPEVSGSVALHCSTWGP